MLVDQFSVFLWIFISGANGSLVGHDVGRSLLVGRGEDPAPCGVLLLLDKYLDQVKLVVHFLVLELVHSLAVLVVGARSDDFRWRFHNLNLNQNRL